jgi:dynein light chain roadblock-type
MAVKTRKDYFNLDLGIDTKQILAAPPRPPPQAEIEDTIKRIASHKGVEGILIFNYEGVALKSTMSRELTTQYAGLFVQLILKARGVVRSIDAENDLVFLRVRTKKHEVLVAPDSAYVLLVVQDPDAHGSH